MQPVTVTSPLAGKLTRLHVSCPTSACARAGSIVADFDPDTSAYVASSRPVAGYLTVTAESMPFTAPPGTVKIAPADSRPTLAGHQVDLNGGRPVTITATVAHPYNDTERTYTVTVPGSEAELSLITVHSVNCDIDCTRRQIDISPSFESGTEHYDVLVSRDVDLVEIAGWPTHTDAHVQITPADSSPAVDGHQVRLAAGQTTRIRLVVTLVKRELPSAPVSQVTYTVDVTRL